MIIITTYHSRDNDKRFSNRKQCLEDTIRSIDNQNLDNLFHLIVDDGSTDDTYNVLRSRYINDSRHYIIRREKNINEPLTSTNARNFAINLCLTSHLIGGIDISKHKYIMFIDSDDIVIDLDKREKFLDKNCSAFLYTDALLFFDNTDTAFFWRGMYTDHAYKNFWVYGQMPYPTMTWRIDFLRELKNWIKVKYKFDGPFDPTIGCGEDVDIALSTFECAKNKKYKIDYLPEVTAGYRIHSYSLASIRNQTVRASEENTVLKRHFGKTISAYLHLRRFFVRPECYIPHLMLVKNIFRSKTSKTIFLSKL